MSHLTSVPSNLDNLSWTTRSTYSGSLLHCTGTPCRLFLRFFYPTCAFAVLTSCLLFSSPGYEVVTVSSQGSRNPLHHQGTLPLPACSLGRGGTRGKQRFLPDHPRMEVPWPMPLASSLLGVLGWPYVTRLGLTGLGGHKLRSYTPRCVRQLLLSRCRCVVISDSYQVTWTEQGFGVLQCTQKSSQHGTCTNTFVPFHHMKTSHKGS